MYSDILLCFIECMLIIFQSKLTHGHGRMIEPASRSSMWRFGYDAPINYDDNQLYCGGYVHQWEVNGGKCGPCGDPWDKPRDNEAGGEFATGTIVQQYLSGANIDIFVNITANHKGWFEFRICENNDITKPITQKCLNTNLLRLTNGGIRYYLPDERRTVYKVSARLPKDLTCSQCVLQWKYNAGNRWGPDIRIPEGGCVGCGPQEQFFGCADISIHETLDEMSTQPPSKQSFVSTTESYDKLINDRLVTSKEALSKCVARGGWVTEADQVVKNEWCNLVCSREHCPKGYCFCDLDGETSEKICKFEDLV
ncbi:unnamed protein product [Owenia fusiformis]|uniref:Chitin-binding type-4 domain-containing protein n=1 Tax=Owenia fusiformis TaxID=6347 RepID=A0A8S4N1E1_OWEFU|nr:unnamed protein product [Owenia fusiformis]